MDIWLQFNTAPERRKARIEGSSRGWLPASPPKSAPGSPRAFRLRIGASSILSFEELTTSGILFPFANSVNAVQALSLSKGLSGKRQRKGTEEAPPGCLDSVSAALVG